MYRLKFASAGIELPAAPDGKKGLELAMDLRPDLLLLDLHLPWFRGDQILEILRRYDWGRRMKVLILSNMDKQRAPERLHQLGYDQYIIKAHKTPGEVLAAANNLLN